MRVPASLMIFALLAAGCGEDSGGDDTPADSTASIRSSYTVDAGTEAYQCTRANIAATKWIKAFTPMLEEGVFRVWLAVDETPGSEGTAPCSATLETDWRLLFVAGTGTGALTLPEDVGFKLTAGEQLVMVIQTVNSTASSLAGDATVEMLVAGTSTDFEEAEGFLTGNFLFSLPAGQTHTVNGGCVLPSATSVFAVMPYMNRYGTHARVWTSSPDQTIVDAPYSHLDQQITTIAPLSLNAGDFVRVTFTYVNTSGATVTFSDSIDGEQCFAMTYVTPPIGVGGPYCGI